MRPRQGWRHWSSRRAGRPVAAVLLTVALATSGVGLAFVAGPPSHLLLTRPRALVWLLLPLGLYVVWFVLFATSSRRRRASSGWPSTSLTGLTASAAGALGVDFARRRGDRPARARLRVRLAVGPCRRSSSRCSPRSVAFFVDRRARPGTARSRSGDRVALHLRRRAGVHRRRGRPAGADPASGRQRASAPSSWPWRWPATSSCSSRATTGCCRRSPASRR